MHQSFWITWEDHRRSRELAQALGATYVPITHPGPRVIRYPVLTFKTLLFLFKNKADLIFCQNPSIVLNTLLCIFKKVFRFRLVVDRHSNFKFSSVKSKNPKWILFHFLSDFTIKRSDLTIVTNAHLKNLVEKKGGRGFILQDKLPTLIHRVKQELKGKYNFVFICTFSEDEPIEQVISAARLIPRDHHIYITGEYKKYPAIEELKRTLPVNVTLTGFLPENEYQSLLYSSDVLIIITDQEYTLTCGAYEAVSLEKPMLLGNTQTIQEYFSQGAIYTNLNALEISACILQSITHFNQLGTEVVNLKKALLLDWSRRFDHLKATLGLE